MIIAITSHTQNGDYTTWKMTDGKKSVNIQYGPRGVNVRARKGKGRNFSDFEAAFAAYRSPFICNAIKLAYLSQKKAIHPLSGYFVFGD